MDVTVLIPTYNRASILKKSLKSLRRLRPNQIIIIDDSSTDDTFQVINEFKKKYDDIFIISNKKRLKTIRSRNKGIKHVKGNILFITDDDHIYPKPDILEKMKKIFKENHEIGVIVLNQISSFTAKTSLKRRVICRVTEWLDIENRKKGYVKYGTSAMAVRKEVLDHVRYDEAYVGNCFRGENQFQTDVRKIGWKIYYDPEILYEHLPSQTGGFRDVTDVEGYYWAIRNHTLFLKKNFPYKLPIFFLIFGQANARKGTFYLFLRAFEDGIKGI